jgi:DNA-binding HxlR family transcriptional regulator
MDKQTNGKVALDRPLTEDMSTMPFSQSMRSVMGKWKMEILWTLVQGKHRFGELRRAIPGITQHMLTLQLRELEADGFLTRIAYAEIPPRVEYELTERALGLRPVFEAFIAWSQDCAQDPETRPKAS